MLNHIRSEVWRTRFASLEQALSVVERQPTLFDSAVQRWSNMEPTLVDIRASYLFERPGRLSEPQARALIRTARTDDPDAHLAAWALMYQFINPIISVVETAEKRYGQPFGESVNTAIADLFTSIQQINLETNTASIFFALSKMMRKEVLRPQGQLLDSEKHLPEQVGWDHFALCVTDQSDTDLVDWQCTIDSLTDFLSEDLVDGLEWNRETRYFARRQARLRGFVACRVSEAATGEHSYPSAIAADLGASAETIKDLQAEVNKVWRTRTEYYREAVADFLGQAA